jgi:hypothetical protein
MRSTSCPSCSSKIFYALQAPGHYLHSQPLLAGVAATNDCVPVLNCLSPLDIYLLVTHLLLETISDLSTGSHIALHRVHGDRSVL